MYFLCSSTRKKNEKKNLLKKCSINGFWLLPNYIVKKKIVLQPCNCIARERARKIVLQDKGVQWAELYFNRENYIAT